MNYDALERLAAQAENEGGYLYGTDGDGARFEVGDVTLRGDDALHFLQHMLRRSSGREAELRGFEGYDHAEREQVRRDARREVLAAAKEAMERFK